MIVPMFKYHFLVFHKEYHNFLEKLQKIGVLHVVGRAAELPEEIKQKQLRTEQIEKAIQFLQQRESAGGAEIISIDETLLLTDIETKQKELEQIDLKLEEVKKEIKKAAPWGDFSTETIENLHTANVHVRFLVIPKKRYSELLEAGVPIEVITEEGSQCYAIAFLGEGDEMLFDSEIVKIPEATHSELTKILEDLEARRSLLNQELDVYAARCIPQLEKDKNRILDELSFDKTILNTLSEADEKLMILEGWVPKTKKTELDAFLEKNGVVHTFVRATPNDNVPILLENNRFGKLFEPIGSLFSLPAYAELDLTVFFAPFFMLFFGFCLGDAGYGLLFIVGAGLYKLKAKAEFKPYLSLIQFLGIGTVIFGAISGTFFGINLIETDFPWVENFRKYFLDPNKMFILSMALGAVQIIFGLFVKAANQIKQYGFQYALATFGWLIVLLGGIFYFAGTELNLIPANQTILYSILAIGGFFILFYSDPSVNVFSRFGKGLWDVYSTVTGIFGDLLSYIRLFALGLSSSILGFVINDIGLEILGSSKILGPVFFVVFLLIGHTLNILISSLGSFVHPMRLTFVEFYKNAGFKGGGEEYQPFSGMIKK